MRCSDEPVARGAARGVEIGDVGIEVAALERHELSGWRARS